MRYLYRFALVVKRLFVGIILFVIWFTIYKLVLQSIVIEKHYIVGSLVLWALTAYFLLPRVHRKLSRLYLPDYFIGRVRTADGLLGDPVNIGIIGTKTQLMRAMKHAGWHLADDITARSSWKIIKATVLRRSYPTAPVSPLFLFGSKQSLAFQQEVNGNPAQRHHVRFWKTPRAWFLPGGHSVQWVGAATFDTNVGFSLFTLQITHKIAADTDKERDYVVTSIVNNNPQSSCRVIKHFSTGYHHRNGGGDSIITDGSLPIVTL